MYKRIKGKKGGTEDPLPFVITVIGLVLIMGYIGLGNARSEAKIDEQIGFDKEEIDAGYDLINFYKINSDLIIRSVLNEDYDDLEPEVMDYFDSRYGDDFNQAWRLTLLIKRGDSILETENIASDDFYNAVTIRKAASAVYPLLRGDNSVLVLEFYLAEVGGDLYA